VATAKVLNEGVPGDAVLALMSVFFEYPEIADGLIGHHFDRRHSGGQSTVK
jgi:hypothetical protein